MIKMSCKPYHDALFWLEQLGLYSDGKLVDAINSSSINIGNRVYSSPSGEQNILLALQDYIKEMVVSGLSRSEMHSTNFIIHSFSEDFIDELRRSKRCEYIIELLTVIVGFIEKGKGKETEHIYADIFSFSLSFTNERGMFFVISEYSRTLTENGWSGDAEVYEFNTLDGFISGVKTIGLEGIKDSIKIAKPIPTFIRFARMRDGSDASDLVNYKKCKN